MNQSDIDKLSGLDIFRNVREQTFTKLIEPSFLQIFPAGTQLIEEGKPAGFLFILLEGSVEMAAGLQGRQTVIEIINPVGLFILAAVLNNDVCLQSARTMVSSRVLMVPAQLVRSLMAEDAGFMQAVVFELASAYRRVVRELKTVKLLTGTQRLANWVLERSCDDRRPAIVKIPFEKRTLAAYLGMTPENLSRALANLSDHGVILRGGDIEIIDRDALQRAVH